MIYQDSHLLSSFPLLTFLSPHFLQRDFIFWSRLPTLLSRVRTLTAFPRMLATEKKNWQFEIKVMIGNGSPNCTNAIREKHLEYLRIIYLVENIISRVEWKRGINGYGADPSCCSMRIGSITMSNIMSFVMHYSHNLVSPFSPCR